jgi:hypothetical protein
MTDAATGLSGEEGKGLSFKKQTSSLSERQSELVISGFSGLNGRRRRRGRGSTLP